MAQQIGLDGAYKVQACRNVRSLHAERRCASIDVSWHRKVLLCCAKRSHSTHAMQEAIESLGRLPPHQYATGWVLSCIGRAYFEMVDYHQAAQAFQFAKKADPSRLEVSFWMLA